MQRFLSLPIRRAWRGRVLAAGRDVRAVIVCQTVIVVMIADLCCKKRKELQARFEIAFENRRQFA
jgi:hypothetical protein